VVWHKLVACEACCCQSACVDEGKSYLIEIHCRVSLNFSLGRITLYKFSVTVILQHLRKYL